MSVAACVMVASSALLLSFSSATRARAASASSFFPLFHQLTDRAGK